MRRMRHQVPWVLVLAALPCCHSSQRQAGQPRPHSTALSTAFNAYNTISILKKTPFVPCFQHDNHPSCIFFSCPKCLNSPCSKQKARAHTNTHTLLISSVPLEREEVSAKQEDKREGGEGLQRRQGASVYLLLAGTGCHDEDTTKHTWTTRGDTVTK